MVRIAVDTAAGPNEDYTVLFIGSERGWLSKVLLREKNSVFLEEMYLYTYQKYVSVVLILYFLNR